MDSARPSYEHTQIGWTMLLSLLVLLPILIIMPRIAHVPWPWLPTLMTSIGGAIAAGVMLLFSTLTVRVERDRLAWHFGIGLVRFSIPLNQIESIERSDVPWTAGFGIHRTAAGWLHNVSGSEVVVVTRKDGARTLIGSDEASRLQNAVQRALAHPMH